MGYRVRRSEGELRLISADEVVKAYRAGLIQERDLVFSEGSEETIPAIEFPGIKPPGFTVRTSDGDLKFKSMYEVDNAWKVGLVDENDDVVGEDGRVTKAKDHPNLSKRVSDPGFFHASHPIRVGLAVALALVAMICFHKGLWWAAMLLSLVVAMQLISLTQVAFRRKPAGR